MSIRISVEWSNIQKFLKILEGILTVVHFDFRTTPIQKELYRCYVKISEGSISYSAIDENSGIPTMLSQLINDQTQSLLRAYYSGFMLSTDVYTWVESSHGFDNLGDWGIKQYEALSDSNKKNFLRSCFNHEDQDKPQRFLKTKIKETLTRLEYCEKKI